MVLSVSDVDGADRSVLDGIVQRADQINYALRVWVAAGSQLKLPDVAMMRVDYQEEGGVGRGVQSDLPTYVRANLLVIERTVVGEPKSYTWTASDNGPPPPRPRTGYVVPPQALPVPSGDPVLTEWPEGGYAGTQALVEAFVNVQWISDERVAGQSGGPASARDYAAELAADFAVWAWSEESVELALDLGFTFQNTLGTQDFDRPVIEEWEHRAGLDVMLHYLHWTPERGAAPGTFTECGPITVMRS